ncbi:MAG: alpha/beta hydrolase [Chitinophagaceae bacterium]
MTTKHFSKISYSRSGAGSPLMLLHGFPLDGNIWSEIVENLSQNFTVLVPDLPGIGGSILDDKNTSIAELAEIVPAILEKEGLENCVLAGHSMGGYISLAVAALFPEKLKGLALLHSTANADTEVKKEARQKAIELIEKGGREAFIRVAISDLYTEDFRQENQHVIEAQTERSLAVPADTLVSFYKAMIARPDRKNVLQESVMPVLFVYGKEDSVIPYEPCLQQTLLPNVSFVKLYERCGHMSMKELPELLQADLRTFVGYCYRSQF